MPKEKKSWLQEWVETKEGKAWHQNYIDFWKMIPEKDRASYDLSGAAIAGDIKEVSGLINKGANVNITHGGSQLSHSPPLGGTPRALRGGVALPQSPIGRDPAAC